MISTGTTHHHVFNRSYGIFIIFRCVNCRISGVRCLRALIAFCCCDTSSRRKMSIRIQAPASWCYICEGGSEESLLVQNIPAYTYTTSPYGMQARPLPDQ